VKKSMSVNGKNAAHGESAPKKHRGLRPAWRPGQSGNPAGRPRGARNKLSEAFLADLLADYQAHGRAAIQACRLKSPEGYLRIVVALLPREIEVRETHRIVARLPEPCATTEEWLATHNR
jgi:hypothetical protein